MDVFLGWNPVYWAFALPALLLAFAAQAMVRNAYRKYLQVPNAAHVTGVEALVLVAPAVYDGGGGPRRET